jgi:hypothetical protein
MPMEVRACLPFSPKARTKEFGGAVDGEVDVGEAGFG